MKENKIIEQLFRREFGSYEVQPSKKVWRGVRSDLFIRNFFHFSPRSINAWYVGGALIVGSVVLFNLIQPKEIFSPGLKTLSPVNSTVASESLSSRAHPVPESEIRNPKSEIIKSRPSFAEASEGEAEDLKTRPSFAEASEGEAEDLKTRPTFAEASEGEAEDLKTRPSFAEASEGEARNTKPVIQQVSEKSLALAKENIINYSGQSVLAWFGCSPAEGCVPLRTVFRNFSQNAVRYSWSFGDGGSSELANPSYIFDEPGTWFVSLTAFAANNEISIFTDSIQVYPLPEARFSMDIQGLPGDGQPVYFYNYSRGAENYLWYFGDGSTSSLKEPGYYFSKKAQTDIKLLAFSATGCSDSTILQDAFKEGEPAFIFPTAFSPNTNGPGTGQYSLKTPQNDIFYPYVIEDPEEYQLKIFNRNGIQIFESSDIHTGWDGYYHQELQPQGVYVWKARAKFGDGRSVVKMGDVTLLWGK
jgi:PKD repeat protein